MEENQPKGIPFTDMKTGETLYAKLEPQILAFINSSDMGINASRGQDFKWKLASEWVHKVKAFRRNETKMEVIAARNGGKSPTTAQILFAIYGEQLRAAREVAEEEASPFEEQYLQDISSKPENVPESVPDADEESVPEPPADVLAEPKLAAKKK